MSWLPDYRYHPHFYLTLIALFAAAILIALGGEPT